MYLEWEPPLEYYWRQREEERQRLNELFHNKGVDTEFEYLLCWWDELLRKWPVARYEALPAGWVHGDYHGRNVVFQGDEMKGLFDFDIMTRGPRALGPSARIVHVWA